MTQPCDWCGTFVAVRYPVLITAGRVFGLPAQVCPVCRTYWPPRTR